ncbi:MAG: hypothetical protein F6I01_002065 [Aerococcus sanguinicola]|nr:hypothetical protein [Aerococcus sp. HMSC062A02]
MDSFITFYVFYIPKGWVKWEQVPVQLKEAVAKALKKEGYAEFVGE